MELVSELQDIITECNANSERQGHTYSPKSKIMDTRIPTYKIHAKTKMFCIYRYTLNY